MRDKFDLRLERRVALSPQACFALWTDPAELANWWGPRDKAGDPFRSEVLEWSPEPGAGWRIRMIAPNGSEYLQAGKFLSIDPSRALRFSFHWIEDGMAGPETEIAVSFAPDGTGTHLVFTQTGFATQQIRDDHVVGWTDCLDRFADAARAAP